MYQRLGVKGTANWPNFFGFNSGYFFSFASTHLAAGRTMSNPRSSRRTCARVATFHVNDGIAVSPFSSQSDSLGDRASGAGPPALSLQDNVDLAEVPGSNAYNENALVNPTFNVNSFAYAVMTSKCVTSKDAWAFDFIGKVVVARVASSIFINNYIN